MATTMKEFSEEAKAKCADLMYYARSGVIGARDLYKMLILSGHLKDSMDYDDIVQDSLFMIMLKDNLAKSLETDPSKSLYGNGMISEYDLYWKVDTDVQLLVHFKNKNINITADQMVMLKKARKDLKRLVTETRDNVVMNFEVTNTPLTKQQTKQLLTKTDQEIETEIKDRAQKNLDAKNKAKKRRVIDDEPEEITDNSNQSTPESVPAKYASSRCKFFDWSSLISFLNFFFFSRG